MVEQKCPGCGCIVGTDEGYEQEGFIYCCEACATGEGTCLCSVGSATEEKE